MTVFNQTDIRKGQPFPLGVNKVGEHRLQISIWKKDVKNCKFRLYKEGKILQQIVMPSLKEDGMEDVFSFCVEKEGLFEQLADVEYDFFADGELFVDEYAKAISGRNSFGKKPGKIRGRFCFGDFDWSDEKRQKIATQDMILYQCHLRGFTRHNSSEVTYPGTFSGLTEKISYLKELGVNTLLFLPIYDFDECMKDETGKDIGKINYWGYGGEAFYYAPKASYGNGKDCVVKEFKTMIKALHQNGFNIVLDMYFVKKSPEFIMNCLRYYAMEYHIDGFRINQDCIDMNWISEDPVLSHCKWIGNSWEDRKAVFGKEQYLEMNDSFMVDARRFLKSDEGQTENFYQRFREQRRGVGVIHYITQNNGFTLRDLISYDVKHNEENGERNMDGTEFNYSWNCGAEGFSRKKIVMKTRQKQEKNAMAMLMLGMATPMILAGDEFGNSQKGNNNAYCQDNLTTWLDWRLIDKNKETFNFMKSLISFRKENPLYHNSKGLSGADFKGLGAPDVSCHGREPWTADFSYYSRELGVLYYGGYYEDQSLYFAFNFHWDSHDFYLPNIDHDTEWDVVFDTADTVDTVGKNGKIKIQPRSIVVLKKQMPKKKKASAK